MSERLCLRCDWTGSAEGVACPRCGAPLYRLSRPEPSTKRTAPASARPRSETSPPGARFEAASADEGWGDLATSTRGGRWTAIALAVALATAGIAFELVRGGRPGASGSTGRSENVVPATTPSEVPTAALVVPLPEEPGGCPEDPSPQLPPPVALNAVPAATADYRFQGSLASEGGNAPPLVEVGRGTTAFSDEGMIGRTVLSFDFFSGLALTPADAVLGRDEYTIELLFRLDRLEGFRKIIDLKDGSDDSGLYTLHGCLNFYPRPPGAASRIPVDSFVQVVLTRDEFGRVSGYVDGVRQFLFVDRERLAAIDDSNTLRLFVDDSVSGRREYSGGAVSQIRLYDQALTAAEIAALACGELRVPLAIHTCPS